MTAIDKGVVTWSGFPGGPGYSVFYAKPAGTFMSHIHDFFQDLVFMFPLDVRFSFPSAGDTIESTTGALSGSWSGTTLGDVIGTNTSGYAGPAGACINWNTNTIVPAGPGSVHAHKLRGRTFLVPFGGNEYQDDGSIVNSNYAAIKTAATTLVTAGAAHFVIWHRPPTGSATGVIGDVLSASVKDRVAVLTSRRA